MRQRIVIFDKDGSKTPVQRCNEPTSDHTFEIVTPEACEACPVRKFITQKAMAAKQYTPPLAEDIRGELNLRYDATPTINFLPCQDRLVATVDACCGQTQEVRVCGSTDCFRMGSEVSDVMCGECPYRRE